jgi:hypothetical protein
MEVTVERPHGAWKVFEARSAARLKAVSCLEESLP